MRLLIVGFSHSIHVARWIGQLVDQGWDIHLFPSVDFGQAHPDLKGVTVHHSVFVKDGNLDVTFRGLSVPFLPVASGIRFALRKTYRNYRINQLVRLIGTLKPDVIHSLEMQSAGYLTLEARKRLKNVFPPWVVTNWGSDIYFFGKLPEHETKIRKMLNLDYYSCECRRDAVGTCLRVQGGDSCRLCQTQAASTWAPLPNCRRSLLQTGALSCSRDTRAGLGEHSWA